MKTHHGNVILLIRTPQLLHHALKGYLGRNHRHDEWCDWGQRPDPDQPSVCWRPTEVVQECADWLAHQVKTRVLIPRARHQITLGIPGHDQDANSRRHARAEELHHQHDALQAAMPGHDVPSPFGLESLIQHAGDIHPALHDIDTLKPSAAAFLHHAGWPCPEHQVDNFLALLTDAPTAVAHPGALNAGAIAARA